MTGTAVNEEMPMPNKTSQLEERLKRVERELQEIKTLVTGKKPIPWWQQIDGDFKDDPVFEEIIREGARLRKLDRPRAMQKKARSGAK